MNEFMGYQFVRMAIFSGKHIEASERFGIATITFRKFSVSIRDDSNFIWTGLEQYFYAIKFDGVDRNTLISVGKEVDGDYVEISSGLVEEFSLMFPVCEFGRRGL